MKFRTLLLTSALAFAVAAPAFATSDHTCQGNADCSTSTGTPTTITNDNDASASSSSVANGGAGGAGGVGGSAIGTGGSASSSATGGNANATGGYTVVAPTISPTFKIEDTNVNTAVGGAGGSVKDSGNSSNLNVNTANGGSVKDSGNSSSSSGAAVIGSGNSHTDVDTNVKTTVDTDVKNTNVVGQGQEQGQDQGQLQGQGQVQGNQNQINIGGSKQKNVTVVVNAAGLAALANSECVLSSTMSVNASIGVPGLGIGGGYAQGDTHPYDECNARAAIQVLGQLGGSIDGVPVPTIMANVAKRLTYVQAAIDEANPKAAPAAVVAAPVKATATASAPAAVKPVRHDGK